MNRSTFEHQAHAWQQRALAASRSRGATPEEAEDVAQEVMLRLWQMRDELDSYASVDGLVITMARHLLLSHRRRRPMEPLKPDMEVTTTASPHDELEEKENTDWLARRLERLPTTQRTLLYMRQVERQSHAEIARLLGIEPTSVSTLLARARRTLLEEIKRRNQQ